MYLEEENDDEELSYDESQNRKRRGYLDQNKEWISEEEEEEGEEDDEMELTDNQNQQLPPEARSGVEFLNRIFNKTKLPVAPPSPVVPALADEQPSISPVQPMEAEEKEKEKKEEEEEEDNQVQPLRLTHTGLAAYVAEILGNQVGYVEDKDLVMLYGKDEKKWHRDTRLTKTKKTIRQVFSTLVDGTYDPAEQEKLRRYVENSSIPSSVAAELKLVIPEMKLDLFDANPYVLGVSNGIIELESGKFRSGRVEDYLTRSAGVAFDPHERCPRFERFINEIMLDDQELILFLQTLFGYLCIGANLSNILVFFQGRGNNGKSVLMNIIQYLFGDYATSLPLAAMLKGRNETVGDDVMALLGYRVWLARELAKDEILHSSKVKLLTGGDSTSARPLFGVFGSVRPIGTPLISTNELPRINDTSDGMWRRIKIVPFRYRVEDSTKDEKLESKLLQELPGILNWALEGLKIYWKHKFNQPQIMVQMLEALRQNWSPLEIFIWSYYEKSSPGEVTSMQLYQHYVEWAQTTANAPNFSQKRFSMEVVTLGIERTRPKETVFGLKRKAQSGWIDPDAL